MRKTLFALLVIWTLPHIAWADGSCNTITDTSVCSETPGCFLDGDTCSDCADNNFYNLNSGCFTNTDTDKLSCEWLTPWEITGADATSDCKWRARCPFGQVLSLTNNVLQCTQCNGITPHAYVTGTFEPQILTGYECKSCPDGTSLSKDQQRNDAYVCLCNEGTHVAVEGQPYNNDNRVAAWYNDNYVYEEASCVSNKYAVTYHGADTMDSKTVEIGTESVWALANNDIFKDLTLCEDGYSLSGWKEGGVTYEPGAPIDIVKRNYEVEPVCDEIMNTYTVKYMCIIEGVDVCSGELKCTEGTSCTVKSPTFEDKSYYVTGWTCSGCGNGATALETTVDLKDHISSLQNNELVVKLTAQIERCPALYEGRTTTYGKYNNGKCTMLKGDYEDDLHNKFTVPETVDDMPFTCVAD